jgi:ABC-type branched-subunit amino acid transport system permease subunit
LFFGLILAVAAEIIETRIYGYNGMIRSLLSFGLGGLLLGGLRGQAIEVESRPNLGIWLSLTNAAMAAVAIALPLGLLIFFLTNFTRAWLSASFIALVALALYGGSNVVNHLVVRLILRWQQLVPRNYPDFLNHAVRLVLLRRVGGGYIFIHTEDQHGSQPAF